MSSLDAVLDRIDASLDDALGRLKRLVAIPSVSTEPNYKDDCARAADWLVDDLESIGFEARSAPTDGHPIVVGHHDGQGPHLLFYGHYDVQPVDPLDLWKTDPFEMTIEERGGVRVLTGRGTADDKGQLMTFVEACRAWKAETGALPCHITVLIEGEEEAGGEHLPPFLEENKDELKADLALVCDTGMWDRDTPAITTMLRGMTSEEVTVHAANRDLHSGFYGGAAANPITVLARALAAMHDEAGRITIPNFYDGVTETPDAVKRQWEALGFDAKRFLGDVDLSEPFGEDAYSALEQTWSRPTAEVNGIWGGYTGAGFKTVIPAEAHAKISFRLVGTQDPHEIRKNFRAFMEAQMPPDCRVEFKAHGASPASVMPVDDPAFEKARQALTGEWPNEAAFVGGGGSIPIVGDFSRTLGMDVLLIGFGQEDDNLHSPNEKYDLKSFHKGTRSWARVLDALAR